MFLNHISQSQRRLSFLTSPYDVDYSIVLLLYKLLSFLNLPYNVDLGIILLVYKLLRFVGNLYGYKNAWGWSEVYG